MSIALDYVPPFEPGIFDFLAARAVQGVEAASSNSYARTLDLTGGHGWFRISWDGSQLWLDSELEDAADAPELLARVRHLFNLAHDPRAADTLLSAEPHLAPRVEALPGIRLPGCVDAAEILLRAMIGQQITVAAARTTLNQLAELSTPSRLPHGSLLRFFPRPEEIATGGRRILRGPQRRIDAIIAVAQMLATGELTLTSADTVDTLGTKLLPIPGIGPWTVGYVAMRVLGSPDIFLPTDAAVRNGFIRLRGGDSVAAGTVTPSVLTRMAEPLQPWRSYATLHLWRVAGEK